MNLEQSQQSSSLPLYESVAGTITDLVNQGTFNPGDRVPSIRRLSRQLKVSINTVKTAYGFLEDRRIIEARPQSGYYVCAKLPEPPGEPEIIKPRLNPADVSPTALVIQIMGDIMSPGLIQFGAAIPDPDLIPTVKLNRMLASEGRRFQNETTRYSIPPGNLKLRVQIAKQMLRAGCTLRPEEIIITNGASEAVFLALQAICRPGDTLALGAPIYFNFLQLIQHLGIKVLEIPMSPTEGIRLSEFESALKSHKVHACLMIPNFNNPLGYCMTDEKKQALVRLLEKHNIPMIEDDINGDLAFSGERPSVCKVWDRSGKVLLCSSFSKTLAPGYRIGWIAPGLFFNKIQRLKVITNIATPTPTQLAVAEFLNSGGYEHHLRSIRKAYSKKTIQMAEAVGRYFPKGTRVSRPEGGFMLWVEMPEAVDSTILYSLAEQRGISIAPGAIFSAFGRFKNCIRLNAALWSEKTHPAVETLGQMARELLRETNR